MTVSALQNHDLKDRLVALIEESKLSSIDMMSETLGIDYGQTLDLLHELLLEKSIEGQISEDGERFYSTSAKVSSAPTLPSEDKPPEVVVNYSPIGKYVLLSGIFTFMAGGIFRAFVLGNDYFDRMASSFVMFGLLLIIVGGLWITKGASVKIT